MKRPASWHARQDGWQSGQIAVEPMTRRQAMAIATTAVTWLGANGLGCETSGGPTAAAADEIPNLPPLNRFPRMVQEYFVAQVRAAEKRALEALGRLKTKEEAEAHVRELRRKIRQSFGPEPERTPLKPRVTGVVEREAYRIEKVIFESRPGFLVTGNLYIPRGRKLPLPGVIGSCGHSTNGKAAEAYQAFAQSLARLGYVTFIFDPIGQGERLQYTDDRFRPRRGVGVQEHLYAGNQQFLVGEFFGAWRAWDGVRALDYLLSREEVKPQHIGITGNSGGGTMTTWLCGVESRWTMAAPSCFVTTFRRNLENELPADTEQCPPQALALGLDHLDFLAALAPKPVILLAQERDFFDVRGAQEAYQRLKILYTLLGEPDNVQLFVGPREHGYSQENREAMYAWFNRATRVSNESKEPPLTIEKDETLACTPRGQVAELGSRTVFEFTRERAQALAAPRGKPTGAELRRVVREVLRIPTGTGLAEAEPPDYRILRPLDGRHYPRKFAANYLIETEPGVGISVLRLAEERLYSRPPRSDAEAILYVSHHSADAELRQEPLLAELLRDAPTVPFYACDVRGIGDSRPDTCGVDQFLKPYGNDYFYAAHALMLDRPYVGQRTFDVLRVLEWLGQIGHVRVHLVARGWGALPGAFAAVLSPRVQRVTLKNAMRSYHEVAISEEYHWPLSCLVPNVLAVVDLPDIYRDLESKQLRQIEPSGA